jgi:maltokinase
MDAALLEEWLPRQRWFGSKGRSFSIRSTHELATLTEGAPAVGVWLVTLDYADGGDSEVYQVPTVSYDYAVEHLTHALLGERDGRWVYDAMHDKEVTGDWLRHLDAEDDVGALLFHREPHSPDIPVDEPSIVIGTEQSNTSLIFGDVAILKLFRKVSLGLNPDIEIHSALHESGSKHIATPLGWVGGRWTDPTTGEEGEGSLAMLQSYLRTATEGWELAKTSVRDLYAEADLHPDEVGGDFAGEAFRLGKATAEVHRDLARALPTGVLNAAEVVELAASMRERLDDATRVVTQLAQHAERLAVAFDDLASRAEPIPVQRIHGDYHLGQVLRTDIGWVLLDFEGEPARPLAERRMLSSPLRDVAGMLRSFDYAAGELLADHPDDAQLRYRASEWAERNREAFCDGYAVAAGEDPRKDPVLLRAYELDKAVYEVVYEARNRPDWLRIPLAAVERLAA